MADELTSKALDTIAFAEDYLRRRVVDSQDAEERERIEDLSGRLRQSASRLLDVEPTIGPQQPAYRYLSQQLDLTRQHIQDLHEYYDYASVDLVFQILNHQLAMLAGPHGPGWGKPRPPKKP